ncbi:MAG: hypothetical protein HQ592_15195, partial [Planctomycetes bacterium]|nr:hypothetical protein [Planctomycetota bacterium]
RWLIGLEFGDNVAENFRNLPVLALQGDQDTLVKVAQSKNFIGKLDAMGYDATFLPIRGEDHWIGQLVFSTDIIFKWMEGRRRPAAPKKITFATYSLKYNKAYWATIDDFARWGKRAKIDVEVTGDNEITVTTSNVATLVLDPPAKLIDRSKRVVVQVAGKPFTFDPPIKTPLRLELAPVRAAGLKKTPLLCGPIKDVHNSRFVFVYGTRDNPVENKMIYNKAVLAVSEWRAFVKSARLLEREKDPLMVRDRDLTDKQRKECNLVLIGTPRTNSVLREIADKLPIKFEGDHTFVVGNKKYTGPGLGLNMIYPSPLAPGRYVVVKSGEYYGKSLSENHKFDMLPDYIIYDSTLDREIFGNWDGMPNRGLCAGFFDKYWQLDDDLMWTQEPIKEPERLIRPRR